MHIFPALGTGNSFGLVKMVLLMKLQVVRVVEHFFTLFALDLAGFFVRRQMALQVE